MAINLIAGLKLLSDLFLAIAGEITKLKGTPKQRLTRQIIELFDILDNAEKEIEPAITNLKALESKTDKIQHTQLIQEVGKSLNTFSEICLNFIRWVSNREALSNSIRILKPEAFELFTSLSLTEVYYVRLRRDIELQLRELQTATYSTPSNKVIETTIEQLNEITSQIQAAKTLLQKFAADNLKVEDFF